MRKLRGIGAGVAAGLGALFGLGWLGLGVQPTPFPPYPEPTPSLESVPLPTGLPTPVARFFPIVLGERAPVVTSAVVTGRAKLTFGRITFPARLRFTHAAGRDYRHYIECTWFGFPVLKANEAYLDGRGRMELPFGVVENEPKIDSAANLGLWGESIWMPSVLATDPRVRWEAVDETTARLIVPFGTSEDRFIVQFDAETGLIRQMEALRYRSANDEAKIPWRLEPLGWQTFHGMLIPSRSAVTWMDQRRPWLVITLENVAYNVDVSRYIRASGL